MERNISIPTNTDVLFQDYCYFTKSECKTHVSKSQGAHNLLKVFINHKKTHLNIYIYI